MKADKYLKSVTDITLPMVREMGLKGLILDVDNTLTTHGNREIPAHIKDWLNYIKTGGIKLILLSNNSEARVSAFAERIDIAYVGRAFKPFPFGVKRACAAMQLETNEAAMVGDQVFTDLLAGKLAGCKSILLMPIEEEKGRFFAVKRYFERRVLKNMKPEETVK